MSGSTVFDALSASPVSFDVFDAMKQIPPEAAAWQTGSAETISEPL